MPSGITGVEGTDQFLQLLVTQMQNQDPLEPMGQEEFIGQLAQLSTLSGIEELNGSFSDMVSQQSDLIRLQELTVGSNLIGQNVEYFEEGVEELQEGTVEKLSIVDGHVVLDVGNRHLALGQVLNILPPPADAATPADNATPSGSAPTTEAVILSASRNPRVELAN